MGITKISDPQQSWGYEDGPWKGPGPSLLAATDFIIEKPVDFNFALSYLFFLQHLI